jgi:hypothetical protein
MTPDATAGKSRPNPVAGARQLNSEVLDGCGPGFANASLRAKCGGIATLRKVLGVVETRTTQEESFRKRYFRSGRISSNARLVRPFKKSTRKAPNVGFIGEPAAARIQLRPPFPGFKRRGCERFSEAAPVALLNLSPPLQS